VREPLDRQVRAFAALVVAAETRAEVRARVEESRGRVARFKSSLRVPMPAAASALPALLGTKDNQALAASFARVAFLSAGDSPVTDA
jgi:hypothetical protein